MINYQAVVLSKEPRYAYSMKSIIMLTAGLGGTIGGYLPVLFGASGFSGWSILGALIGGIAGIYIGYKISQN